MRDYNASLSFIFRHVFSERLIDKIRERSDSLFLSPSPRLSRKRGSSAGPSIIEPQGQQRIVVLGPTSVGKSTICATYAGAENDLSALRYSKKNEIYNSCVFIQSETANHVKQYNVEMSVPKGTRWDGTVNGYKSLLLESDGYLLVYSKENRQSYMKLVELVSDIQKLRKCNIPPIVVVGNKDDLDHSNTLGIHDSEHHVLGSFPHFNVSALENDGLQEAFKCLVQMVAQQKILTQT